MISSLILSLLILFSVDQAQAATQSCAAIEEGLKSLNPSAVFCANRLFVRSARQVAQRESQIPPDPRFAAFQRMTLRWQGYTGREAQMGDLARLMIVQVKDVRPLVLERAILRYQRDAHLLMDELFEHIKLHTLMNPESEQRLKYLTEIKQTIELINTDEAERGYEPLACDYVSQPINALWFLRHAIPRLRHLEVLVRRTNRPATGAVRFELESEIRGLLSQIAGFESELRTKRNH